MSVQFPAPRPLAAMITSLSGPPVTRHIRRIGTQVLALPNRYSMTSIVFSPEGIMVVDVGSIEDIPRILGAIRFVGRSPDEIRFVVPSHFHFDHVMGIDALAQMVQAKVLLGPVQRQVMISGRKLNFPTGIGLLRPLATWPMQGMQGLTPVDRRHGMDFGFPWGKHHFNAPLGPEVGDGQLIPGFAGWRLHETPGHSDDAIALHHGEARILLPGDTVRNFYGGEWNALQVDRTAFAKTSRRLRNFPVDTIVPGHGPVLQGTDIMARLIHVPRLIP